MFADKEKMKRCPDCGEIKPIGEFPKHNRMPDGIYTYCKPCTNERNRISYHKFGDRRRADTRAWQKKNGEWRRNYVNGKYKEMKDRIIEAYGGKCARCGFLDRRALCIDHVNGNGLKERKSTTPAGLLRKIIRENFPSNYQLLCANCNQIKAIENSEIPVSSIYLEN